MIILSIDASFETCSVAIEIDGVQKLLTQKQVRYHSQFLLPMIHELLELVDVQLNQVDLIVYSKGPGSFTGLRLVCAVVQALSYVHNIKTQGVSSLQAKAQALFEIKKLEHVMICDDARMNEVYAGHYQLEDAIMQLQAPEICIEPKDLLKQLKTQSQWPVLFGSGLSQYEDFESYPKQLMHESLILAPLLIRLAKKQSHGDKAPETILPAYIRTPQYQKKRLK